MPKKRFKIIWERYVKETCEQIVEGDDLHGVKRGQYKDISGFTVPVVHLDVLAGDDLKMARVILLDDVKTNVS